MATKTESLGKFENSLGQTVEIYRFGDDIEIYTRTEPGKSVRKTMGTKAYTPEMLLELVQGESTTQMSQARATMERTLAEVPA